MLLKQNFIFPVYSNMISITLWIFIIYSSFLSLLFLVAISIVPSNICTTFYSFFFYMLWSLYWLLCFCQCYYSSIEFHFRPSSTLYFFDPPLNIPYPIVPNDQMAHSYNYFSIICYYTSISASRNSISAAVYRILDLPFTHFD